MCPCTYMSPDVYTAAATYERIAVCTRVCLRKLFLQIYVYGRMAMYACLFVYLIEQPSGIEDEDAYRCVSFHALDLRLDIDKALEVFFKLIKRRFLRCKLFVRLLDRIFPQPRQLLQKGQRSEEKAEKEAAANQGSEEQNLVGTCQESGHEREIDTHIHTQGC